MNRDLQALARAVAPLRQPDRITAIEMAKGRWRDILPRFGFTSKQLNGRNQPCPMCGGKDRFRWTNHNDDGCYYCNQCGAGNGVTLIAKTMGISWAEAAKRVEQFLGANAFASMHPDNLPLSETHIPKSTRDCALWLRKHRPAKELEEFLNSHVPQVRWWLSTQSE